MLNENLEPVILASSNIRPSPLVIEIVPANASHVRQLQRTIRDDDRREIEAYGFTCAKGLWRSYKQGIMNRTALIDGKVSAMWGVAGTFLGDVGSPWLLTAYEVEKISPLRFARIYKNELNQMLKLFPTLVNFVLADYDKAVRLLQICGFELGEPEKLGNGYYRKFEMKAVN